MLFKKLPLLHRSVLVLATLVLSACSGGGQCNTGTNPPTPGVLSLAIAAPSQYPAGLPNPIVVPITMINTSDTDAVNLVYTVPQVTNHTGVVIIPNPTGVTGNDCTNIPAGTSCNMTATIAAYANPGSFTVLATPTSSSLIAKAINKLSSSNSIEVTASLGLVNIPNTQNQFYILPTNQTVLSESAGVNVYVSVLVKSSAGFTGIDLVDGDTGNKLDATLFGELSTAVNTVNTYLVHIPNGVTLQNIQAFALDGSSYTCDTLNTGANDLTACSNNAVVGVTTGNVAILNIQPTYVVMSPDYLTQVVTLTNTGVNSASNITLPTLDSHFAISQNLCTGEIAPNGRCTFVLTYTPDTESGIESINVAYNNGSIVKNIAMTVSYLPNPIGVLTVSPSSVDLNSHNVSQIITISNTGTAALTDISIAGVTAPLYQPVPHTCGSALQPGESCIYVVSYPGADGSGNYTLPINYSDGSSKTQDVPISYVEANQYGYVVLHEHGLDLNLRGVYMCGLTESASFPSDYSSGCFRQTEFTYTGQAGAITIATLGGNRYAYVTTANSVTKCGMDIYGELTACNDDAGQAMLDVSPLTDPQDPDSDPDNEPVNIVIANTGGTNYAYVLSDADSASNYSVYTCTLTESYIFDTCTRLSLGNASLDHPTGIAVDNIYDAHYVYLNASSDTIENAMFRYNLDPANGQPIQETALTVVEPVTGSYYYGGGLASQIFAGNQHIYSGYADTSDPNAGYAYSTSSCVFNNDGTVNLDSCVNVPYTPDVAPPYTITLNVALNGNWYGYFGGTGTGFNTFRRNIYKCSIDPDNYALVDCAPNLLTVNDYDWLQSAAFSLGEPRT